MIFDKVDELCELVADTKQYNDYLEANVNLETDGKGIDLINAFSELQDEYIKTYQEGDQGAVKSMENVLEARHKELMDYPATGAYIRAKQALDELLNSINERIMHNLELNCDHDDCDCCSDESCKDCH
jgi:cell fate (sporulation/competence/biofilm development) regulator YlbF (YheA/YmcA/DUF963 family)